MSWKLEITGETLSELRSTIGALDTVVTVGGVASEVVSDKPAPRTRGRPKVSSPPPVEPTETPPVSAPPAEHTETTVSVSSEPVSSPPAAPSVETAPVVEAVPVEEGGPTRDDIRKMMMKVVESRGAEAVHTLLVEYQIEKLSQLPERLFGEIMDKLEKLASAS